MSMRRRGFLQISFGWMFAILAGIVILFLAIFAVTKFIDQGQAQGGAEAAQTINILLNPLETGLEEGVSTFFTTGKETRIFTFCSPFGSFGKQSIEVSQKDFNQWSTPLVDIDFENKIIFSDDATEGQIFYLFSKPFSFPFKIADVVYLSSEQDLFCFKDPPQRIEQELMDLNQNNILVTQDCPEEATTVCFTETGCSVTVNERQKTVTKQGRTVYYEGDALLYAAIFSSQEIYECNLDRLMKRGSQLADIYATKQTTLTSRNVCTANVNLLSLTSGLQQFQDSQDLYVLARTVQNVERQHNVEFDCRLW